MNLGKETETLECKKTTDELKAFFGANKYRELWEKGKSNAIAKIRRVGSKQNPIWEILK